jgi:poly(3-hydroxybutyrate) depolymerase
MSFKQTLSAITLGLVLTACGGGNSPDVAERSSPDPENPCGQIPSSDSCINIEFPENSGEFRHFIVHLPVSPFHLGQRQDQAAAPLLISLHGAAWYANDFNDLFHLNDLADEYGYISVLPDSSIRPSDGNKRWNTSNTFDRIPDVDDVGFVLAIIDKISTQYAVDSNNIHVFGWSNGGFMANRLACEHPQIFTSIFSFAGSIRHDLAQTCNTDGYVGVSHLHGTKDPTISYNGGSGYYPAIEAIEQWGQRNACNLTLETTTSYNFSSCLFAEETDLLSYQDCVAPVQHLRVNNGSHGPGQFDFNLFHQVMTQFFQASAESIR